MNSTRNWSSDLVEGQGLELLTPESAASQLLNWEQLWWVQLLLMSFQLLFVSILFFCLVAPVLSQPPQCTNTSLSMERGNNSSIIIKVSMSLNSFAFLLHILISDFCSKGWSEPKHWPAVTFVSGFGKAFNLGKKCRILEHLWILFYRYNSVAH